VRAALPVQSSVYGSESMTSELLTKTIDRLIAEGEAVLATEFDAGNPNLDYLSGRPRGVDLEGFSKFAGGCKHLLTVLGRPAEVWRTAFDKSSNSPENTKHMLGTVRAIREAISHDLLRTTEDLVRADTFAGLLEQAGHLHASGYHVAAGTLARAVLEEHLKSWCTREGCVPTKSRPTISSYKDELYRAKHITATVMKHVEAMAAIGNDAAHNAAGLQAGDVARLLRDVQDFTAKHG
jgi:hypothetical protein